MRLFFFGICRDELIDEWMNEWMNEWMYGWMNEHECADEWKKEWLIHWKGLPGDQPELSKCIIPLLSNHKSKLVGDGLELKVIAERLLI